MKIILTAITASALLATAAIAQTVAPASPSTTPGMTTPMVGPTETPAPADQGMVAPTPTAETALTERNGKWYAGDREATRDEIASYKKAKKSARPG